MINNNFVKFFIKKIFGPSILLFILIIGSYWPIFNAELVFDDRPTIIQNNDIKSEETSWLQLWSNDYWGMPLKSKLSHKSYRPLTILTFRLNYFIHQLNPFGYHLINILLHYLVTILFYRLCQWFYRLKFTNFSVSGDKTSSISSLSTPPSPPSTATMMTTTTKTTTTTSWIQSTPFIMAALFAVHPIHTDCVCSVVGRAELLSAIFYLSSILLWNLNPFINIDNNNDENVKHKSQFIRWSSLLQLFINKYHRLLSILMALFGFLCKEQAIFVLLYLAINHLFINNNNNNNNNHYYDHDNNKIIEQQQQQQQQRRQYRHQQQQHRRRYRSIFTSSSSSLSSSINYGSSSSLSMLIIMIRSKLQTIIILATVFIGTIYIRFLMMGYSLPIFNRFDNPASRMQWPSRHLTYGYLILYHYWMMFYPQFLSCDWTHSSLNLIDYQSINNNPLNINNNNINITNTFDYNDNDYPNIYYRTILVIVCFIIIKITIYKWILFILRQQQQQQQQHQQQQQQQQRLRQQRNRYKNRNVLKAYQIIDDNDDNDENNNGGGYCNHFYYNINQFDQHQSIIIMMIKILLSLSLTIIPFIPVSNILFPVGFIIAERILYLPSIGFILLFGFGIDYLSLLFSDNNNNNNNNNTLSSLLSSLFSLLRRRRLRRTSSTKCDHHHHPHHNNIVVGTLDCQYCHKSSAINGDDDSWQPTTTTTHSGYYSCTNNPRNRHWKFHPIRMATIMLIIIFSAKTFLRSYDWTNEFVLYESGLKVNPRNIKLLNNLGRLYETTITTTKTKTKSNSIEIAIELYRKAISIEPTDLRSYLNLGNVYHKHFNDTRMAEQIYRNALKQFDQYQQNQQSLIEIDNRLSLSPLYLTLLIRLTELLSIDSTRQNDLKIIQDKLIETQFLLDPITILTTSCDHECNRNHHHHRTDDVLSSIQLDQLYNLGVVHYQQGRIKEAFNYFERILSMNPNHVDTLLTSARIIQDEHLDQLKHIAYDRLEHLIRLGKDDESIYFNLATLAINNRNFNRAKRLFKKAIAKRESFAEAHYNLALLLVKEMDPTPNNLGQQQQQQQQSMLTNSAQLREAIDHLQRVLLINPKHINSMFILAELYAEELQQLDRARYYYQLILDHIDPNNIQAKHNLCVLWHKQNNIDKSIHCFEDLLQYLSSSSSSINDKSSINYWQIIQEQITYLWKIKNFNQTKTKSIESLVNNNINNTDYDDNNNDDEYRMDQQCQNVSDLEMLRNHYHHHYGNYYMTKMCFI
uniref:dolichyl-phosphate-mannose--protein mannosyltransferase n=1 Tax=Dermatophagoides pteronyssinus TaxID=6956 RepID=A0A6P6XNG6_DERPT|nr:transmembrane and TPR repeat-containing protein CG4050-like [Dermatophagoides pteronyssinus]